MVPDDESIKKLVSLFFRLDIFVTAVGGVMEVEPSEGSTPPEKQKGKKHRAILLGRAPRSYITRNQQTDNERM